MDTIRRTRIFVTGGLNMQYKKGDIVTVKSEEQLLREFGNRDNCIDNLNIPHGFNHQMARYCGRRVRIRAAIGNSYRLSTLNGNTIPWTWGDEMLVSNDPLLTLDLFENEEEYNEITREEVD
jgi:hypothetical protein